MLIMLILSSCYFGITGHTKLNFVCPLSMKIPVYFDIFRCIESLEEKWLMIFSNLIFFLYHKVFPFRYS